MALDSPCRRTPSTMPSSVHSMPGSLQDSVDERSLALLIPPPAKRWGGWHIVSAANRCVGWGVFPGARSSRICVRCPHPALRATLPTSGRDKKERASLVSTPQGGGKRKCPTFGDALHPSPAKRCVVELAASSPSPAKRWGGWRIVSAANDVSGGGVSENSQCRLRLR
jgi:hypothetical protein